MTLVPQTKPGGEGELKKGSRSSPRKRKRDSTALYGNLCHAEGANAKRGAGRIIRGQQMEERKCQRKGENGFQGYPTNEKTRTGGPGPQRRPPREPKKACQTGGSILVAENAIILERYTCRKEKGSLGRDAVTGASKVKSLKLLKPMIVLATGLGRHEGN